MRSMINMVGFIARIAMVMAIVFLLAAFLGADGWPA